MSPRPKRVIAELEACVHGGINDAGIKSPDIDPGEIIDFSVSTNPFMPPLEIREILSNLPIGQYPDSQAKALRGKLAERLKISPENILAGSGTTELIRLVALTYFRRGDRALILGPTYGEYEPACRMSGARIVRYRAKETKHFIPEIRKVADLVMKHQPRGVFICNPNNPTGNYLGSTEIREILNAIGDGLLVMDEAYISFVEDTWESLELMKQENVIVLRSMTKDYGMPGLRLGYAVASRDIIDDLRPVLPPWNVNIAAQKVGEAVLDMDEYLEQSLLKVRQAKQFLVEGLSQQGLEVLPSDANYFLVKVGSAATFREALIKSGILVRDCTSFGLPEYIRIAPRTLPECRKLLTAVESVMVVGTSRIG